MIKSVLAIPLLISLSSIAEEQTYQSIANIMSVKADGTVLVRVLLREEGDEIACAQSEYDFDFSLDSIVGQKWYDTLMLSRNTNSLVDFHYSDTNCSLNAITLPKLFQLGGDVGSETGGGLVESGENGNIALISTNGLTSESYDASSFYGQDTQAAAFDGYTYKEKINVDATDKIGRGIWMAKRTDSNGALVTPWLQIDFGKNVTVSGMRSLINAKSLELGRGPRNITILTSEDGTDFTIFDTYRLIAQTTVDVPFASPITARFIRLQVDSNYGDSNFVEIDEWELYQP
jgi:hypothetical protein